MHSHGEHALRLFDSPKNRAAAIASYVREGLLSGGSVLVVATPANWQQTTATLERDGFDVQSAISQGRLTILDASETLAQFMQGETPDPQKLQMVMGRLIDLLAQQPGRLRVYGEMVDVLAECGNFRGAHRLEELWNELSARIPFDLFCGYTSERFGDMRTAPELKSICDAHSEVCANGTDLLGDFLIERARQASGVIRP